MQWKQKGGYPLLLILCLVCIARGSATFDPSAVLATATTILQVMKAAAGPPLGKTVASSHVYWRSLDMIHHDSSIFPLVLDVQVRCTFGHPAVVAAQ